MTEGTLITADTALWMLSHEDHCRFRYCGKELSVDALYEHHKRELAPGITVISSDITGYQLSTDGDVQRFDNRESMLNHLKEHGILSYGLEFIGYDRYERTKIISNLSEYDPLSSVSLKGVDFRDIGMDTLLRIYAPMSTHFTVCTYHSDPREYSEQCRERFPEDYLEAVREYELYRKCNEDNDMRPFYENLGLKDISDLVIGTDIFSTGESNIEIVTKISVTEQSVDWLRQFEDDYSMGIYNDLTFYNEDVMLYESVSHEEMRSDYTGIFEK